MSSASSSYPGGASGTTGEASPWPAVPRRRKVGNAVFWLLCGVALLLVITPCVWLAAEIVARGVSNFQRGMLSTRTNGITGGLSQAIVGTIVITLGAIVVGGTISVLTGLYLSEFAKGGRRSVLRGGYEVLAGIPSIVLGYVGYVALVVGLGWGFSLLAAFLVMSVLTIPYITKATETSLAQVPSSYREGAEALGIPPSWAMRRIVLKTAVPGIITGVLVAAAIAVGETAPLLYTAGWSDVNPTSLTHSAVGFLTYPVYYFAPINQPNAHANSLAYVAALLLLVFVLILIVVGRLVAARARRFSE
jgi:phosphate transport system permease protein